MPKKLKLGNANLRFFLLYGLRTTIKITIFSSFYVNPLSAKLIKWSNTLKQIVGKLPTICLSVFDHLSGLALKGLKIIFQAIIAEIRAKKYTLSIELFSKWKWNLLIWNKCYWRNNLYQGKEKTKEFLWNSYLKNREDLLNSSYCFNQNVPYATIMLNDINITIEEFTVNIKMEFF